jgi:hypothetical protein
MQSVYLAADLTAAGLLTGGWRLHHAGGVDDWRGEPHGTGTDYTAVITAHTLALSLYVCVCVCVRTALSWW